MSDLWKPKFLWFPRTVDGKLRWWEWIEVEVSPMEPFEERQRILCHPQMLR